MKNVTGIIALLVIAGCAFFLFQWKRSQPVPGAPVAHLMPLVCDACEHVWAAKAGQLPVKCVECGKKTAYRGQQCRDCGKVFPWPGWGKPSAGGSGLQCKYCQSTYVGEVEPDAIEIP